MKTSFALAAAAAALTTIVSAGCTREEPKPSAPPTPPAGAATLEPPNPPTVLAPPEQPLKGAGPAEKAGRAIGEQIDDATLTAKVKAALIQAPDVKGGDVNVNTEKSVVQLSGFVGSQTEMDRAVAIARSINGVKEVHSKMSLKSGK